MTHKNSCPISVAERVQCAASIPPECNCVQVNPECKRCGLLRSTIEGTGKLCVSPSTTNIPPHDFGEEVNYLQTGNGHCLMCHKNYKNDQHIVKCHEKGIEPTPYACEKCKEIISNPTSDWKEKFDEKFTRRSLGLEDKGRFRDDWFVRESSKSRDIKNFIESLLAAERARIAGEIRKLEMNCIGDSQGRCEEANEALEHAARIVESGDITKS